MPTTDFMDFKTLADIQGHFDIALDLLLKKENFGHGEWPYKLYQREVCNCIHLTTCLHST